MRGGAVMSCHERSDYYYPLIGHERALFPLMSATVHTAVTSGVRAVTLCKGLRSSRWRGRGGDLWFANYLCVL